MNNLFKNTSHSQFAVITLGAIVSSGYLLFQTATPVINLAARASVNSDLAQTSSRQMVSGAAQVAGASSSTVSGGIVASIQSQVASLVTRVTKLETSSPSTNVVLGDSTENTGGSQVKLEYPAATNLLRNSSYEEASDNAPRQWQYQYSSTNGNTKTTAEAVRSGTMGLKFMGGNGALGISQPGAKTIERRDYALSLWVKPVNTSSHSIKLSFWDEVNNKEAASKTYTFSGTKEWSRIVFQISNKNTWNGKKWFPMITVTGLNQGSLYIDDAQLEEASSYTAYHFVGGGASQSHVSVLGDGSVEADAHGNVYPAVNGIGSIGTGDNKFQELRLSKATIDKDGSLSLEGGLTVNGNSTLKGTVSFSARFASHLLPDTTNTYDLGSTTYKWRDAYVDGIGYIDGISLQNAETIGNGTNGDIIFTDSSTSNVLTFDLDNAADTLAVSATEDLDLGSSADGADALRLYSSAGGIDIEATGAAAGEDIDIAATGSSVNVSSSEDAVDSITLRSARGGIDLSTGNAGGNANLTLRSAGTLLLDTSSSNSQLLANVGTFALNTLAGDAVITVQASNADSEDFILRVSENSTASTANGRDIFLATVDDLILYGDTYTLTATNGVNYVVSGADYSVELNGDLDYIVRAGDAAREVAASSNDIQLAAEDALIVDAGDMTLTSSEDAVNAIALSSSRGGIQLSTSYASSNGVLYLKSAGSLVLDTSAKNTNILLQAGTGQVDVSSTINLTSGGYINWWDTAGSSGIGIRDNDGTIEFKNNGGAWLGIASSASGGGWTDDGTTVRLDTGTDGVMIGAALGESAGSLEVVGDNDILLRAGAGARQNATSGNNDLQLAAEDAMLLDGASLTLATSGGDMTAEVNGDNDFIIRAGDAAREVAANNNDIQLAAEADLLLDSATFTLATSNGDVVINALATNADTEDFSLRVGDNATATTANGRDVFIAANDDMILYMDNLSVTATNGIDYAVSGADYNVEVNGDNDYVLRVGDGAAESSANNNDVFIAAEADVIVRGATWNLTTSGGDQVYEADGDQDFIIRAGDAAREVAADNNDIQLAAEADLLLDGATFTLATSNGDVVINALATNAVTEDISIRVGDDATATTANGQDFFLAAVDDVTVIGDTFTLTASNGAAVNVTGDTTFETNGDNDYVLRVGDGAAESSANNNDVFIAAEADVIVRGATWNLTTSGGDQVYEADGDQDFIIRAGDAAREVVANNNDVQIAAEADVLVDGATFTLATSGTGAAALALRSTNGGIDISAGFADAGNNSLVIRTGGTMVLDTSAKGTDLTAQTGTGLLTLTSARNNAQAVLLQATAGGIDIQATTASAGEDIDIAATGSSINISATESAVDGITLRATQGGIELSTGYADNGNANLTLKSAGTLTLDTSAKNSNIMLRAGTGRIDLSGNTIMVNSGAGTLDLSSNNTISIVSSTTARVWGETSTLIGRAGTATRVHGRLCIEGSGDGSTCPAGGDGRLFVNTTGEATDDPGDVFDLAEYYPASEAVDPGTVVVADSNARATVKKSGFAYQRVLGVVSTSPALKINEGSFSVGGDTITGASDKPLIALVGRVPVKVTNESGSIRVGDRLVASSTSGYAMKATKQGLTLGMALEDLDFTDSTEGKVMTFVNVSWYFPEVIAAIEAEHAQAAVLGTVPDVAGATAEALAESETGTTDPAVSDASTSVAAGADEVTTPELTVAIPPTEFPNILVADSLTVGKKLTVNGTSTFQGEVTAMADATFQKNIVVVGNVKVGGNLEVAGAMVMSLTAGSSLTAGDPVSVNASGQAVKAGGSNAVVGVATVGAAAGDKVAVAVAGKVGGLTGLVAGSRYFVNEAGVLTTDGQGAQSIGVALSATEMLVQPGVGLGKVETTISPEPVVEPAPEPTAAPTEAPAPTAAPTEAPAAEPTTTVTPTEAPVETSQTETPIPTPTEVVSQ